MNDDTIFALLDPEFYVSLELRQPGPEYRDAVGEILSGERWSTTVRGLWTYVEPSEWARLEQGWKLHVSATPWNAAEVLRRVATVLRGDPAYFKFASDPLVVRLLSGKNWPREGGGKFITIYPSGDEAFQRLGRALAEATADLDGPYILSDRRVPGSRIVFYRYGEHVPTETVDARGHRVHHMRAPTGQPVRDRRTGYYRLPEWVADPYGARPVTVLDGEKKVRLGDRYEIDGAFKYSNTGGVYRGRDLERDCRVVIREARPFTGWIDEHTDAVGLLHKEGRILRAMDGTGWAPGFVDELQVWEHHYLVMEDVHGAIMRDAVLSGYFRPRRIASPRRLFWTFRHLILELVRAVEAFHEKGIIVRDLTTTNVLVPRRRRLCLIDFEYAWEREGELTAAAGIHTPGFASPAQMSGKVPPSEADDFYAIGAIVVEIGSLMAGGLRLNRDGVLATAQMMMDEVGLPRELLAVARGLLDPDPATRWTGDQVRRALGEVRAAHVPWAPAEPGKSLRLDEGTAADLAARAAAAARATCEFFEAAAKPERPAFLFPVSPEAFLANTVCIQLGACGPIEHVRRVRGSVPGAWLDWLERQATAERVPPGLYVGLGGVALTLAACGRGEAALGLMRKALESPVLATDADLYHGAAGVGLAALQLGVQLDDAALREAAVALGGDLEGRAERRRHGIAWRAEDGLISCGVGEGGAGIALFYTALGAATRDERWWRVAREALEFEFSQVRRRSGYLWWPSVGATRRSSSQSPHFIFGTAGVGAAAIRLHACTGDPALLEWAERCAHTLGFRWTNKLWQDMGYSGWGDTFLDMHAATGDPTYREHALRIAQVVLPAQVSTRYGTAFPGNGLSRVSTEFGMGASGIALFLHRVAHGGHRAFFADALAGFPASAPPPAAEPEPRPAARRSRSAGFATGTSGAAAARHPAGLAR
jgi:Lanthionine synthetase C-like protein/Protein kinase domain